MGREEETALGERWGAEGQTAFSQGGGALCSSLSLPFPLSFSLCPLGYNDMCMDILPTCVSVYHYRPEEVTESSGTGVTKGCEPQLGPLKEQVVFLPAEPSVQL